LFVLSSFFDLLSGIQLLAPDEQSSGGRLQNYPKIFFRYQSHKNSSRETERADRKGEPASAPRAAPRSCATHQHCPDRALGLARRTLLRATEDPCMLSNLTMNSGNTSQSSCDTPPLLYKFIPFIIDDEKYFLMIKDSEWFMRSCILTNITNLAR
jgi:hypothetical protein